MKGNINKTINSRMLKIMDASIITGRVKNKTMWCRKIGLPMQNLKPQILTGKQTFTHTQIYNAVKLIGSSADYVYGLSNKMIEDK